MTHTLTTTVLDVEEGHVLDVQWEIGGTCQPQCAIWWTCLECDGVPGPYADSRDEDDPQYGYDDMDAHGAHHRWVEGAWMTLGAGQCALDYSDAVPDSAHDIAIGLGLGGSTEIDVDYMGDGEWQVLKIDDDEKDNEKGEGDG